MVPGAQRQLDLLIGTRRHQHRKEAAHDEVINIPLRSGELPQVRGLLRGDDGVMIRDLGIVHQIFGRKRAAAHQLLRKGLVVPCHHGTQAVRQRRNDVVGDVARIRARIGQQLVLLIEGLHKIQRFLCGIGVFFIRIALQLRQVIGRRRRRHAAHPAHLPDGAGPRTAGLGDPLGQRAVKCTAVSVCIAPDGREARELQPDAVEFLRHKAADFPLPRGDKGQRRCLHAPGRELRIVFARQGARHVQADEPVGLAARLRGAEQIFIVRRRAQICKAVADGLVCLGRDPKPLCRLVPARLGHDPARNELTLAPGIRGDDEAGDVAALHQALHHAELPRRLRDDDELHILREHRQVGHVPLLPLFLIDVRVSQRDQMPERPGDNIAVALQVALAAAPAAEHARQLPADGGLLRQNELSAHQSMTRTAVMTGCSAAGIVPLPSVGCASLQIWSTMSMPDVT